MILLMVPKNDKTVIPVSVPRDMALRLKSRAKHEFMTVQGLIRLAIHKLLTNGGGK